MKAIIIRIDLISVLFLEKGSILLVLKAKALQKLCLVSEISATLFLYESNTQTIFSCKISSLANQKNFYRYKFWRQLVRIRAEFTSLKRLLGALLAQAAKKFT